MSDQSIDTSAVDAEEFAKNMSAVTDEQLREGISGPMRDEILDEIFKPEMALEMTRRWISAVPSKMS